MIDNYSKSDEGEYSVGNESLNNDNCVVQTNDNIQQSLTVNQDEEKAPLATKWTFWLDSQKNKLSSKQDYEAGLEIISSVETVQEFWSVFNNIPTPDRLANRVTYHLMRQNRKPLWEDKENENGGIYTYRCPKNKTNTVWQELCLAVIGEQFSVIDGDDIVGISIQSREAQLDIIQIWNLNPSEEAQKAIDKTIVELFSNDTFLIKFYKANSSHINFEAKNNQQ
ncbi:unnamed protein product [Rotaria sp. Silwood2]|nr:unnamed protein product [Rotaria sp. Silwood2]CAF2958966.1 unnamed protein product [Rotaria sp. Silwood2]CAF3218742.1 unnamed protein product [Rotaria sp. Silwood2]CAF3354049.1 unnamed protein product [Rotaria sp. Silwood2]CAF3977906.1 unnamed protein product [Rotaria sp. Silwood2]